MTQSMDRFNRNWDLIKDTLAAESSGKSPRLFSSRRTLFGIPSALDQELEMLSSSGNMLQEAKSDNDQKAVQKAAKDKPLNKKTQLLYASKNTRSEKTTRAIHNIDPVFDSSSKVLILGTMPSPKSRETGFYYNHPQNRFWPVMGAIFSAKVPKTNDEKMKFALAHKFALWDVLAECEIEGASDATIASCIPNNIDLILGKAPIDQIFCTGAKAKELYDKFCFSYTNREAVKLPSTSSANASMSLEKLIESYKQILKYI